ncbi:MAG: DsrE family protein [Gammaproteobacteria bacterium]|nr:DsrE family protein [Gammaproteobacteria bacterium]
MSNTNSNTYLFTLTAFTDDSDRMATPLVLANSALASGADVVLWLTMGGVELAKQGATKKLTPKSFAPVQDLLESFIESGGHLGVCPPCGKTHGLTDENMLEEASWMGAVAMLEASTGRQTFSF